MERSAVMDTTAILNVWKRDYLDRQLAALAAQTLLPRRILILQNEFFIDLDDTIATYREIFSSLDVIHASFNWKYFGRFSIVNTIDTKFCWVLDDDVIPSPAWLERSVEACEGQRAIICPTGRIIPKGSYTPERVTSETIRDYFIGDCFNNAVYNYCPNDTFVDYGCSSYFFQSSWIRNFWKIWPVTFESGEDIHLSASSKILAGIPTVVLRQLSENDTGNQEKNLGFDVHASWRKEGFIDMRERVIRYLVGEGWKPLLW